MWWRHQSTSLVVSYNYLMSIKIYRRLWIKLRLHKLSNNVNNNWMYTEIYLINILQITQNSRPFQGTWSIFKAFSRQIQIQGLFKALLQIQGLFKPVRTLKLEYFSSFPGGLYRMSFTQTTDGHLNINLSPQTNSDEESHLNACSTGRRTNNENGIRTGTLCYRS